ncbi:hypothetical protein JYU34_002505 [Plutella xylostella]|uniref:Uncharacterized protein n=1 Tax=Plutella xylostella TaxID=51655 RepID=A0ABQ7R2G3_PLUXY|nr:hypothetical protein JYU34_002505 [Plutella xylostella]
MIKIFIPDIAELVTRHRSPAAHASGLNLAETCREGARCRMRDGDVTTVTSRTYRNGDVTRHVGTVTWRGGGRQRRGRWILMIIISSSSTTSTGEYNYRAGLHRSHGSTAHVYFA